MQYQLADLFESVVAKVPDRPALIANRTLTYAELDARANQFAHHLREAGIGRGDHVGFHMKNGTEFVEGMIACFKIGAVPVNVNYRYVEDELRYLYDNADLACLLFDTEFGELVTTVAPEIDTFRHFVCVVQEGSQDAPRPEGTVEYESALEGQPTTSDDLQDGRSPDDLYMLYTGGTTGMPKGVMWRHEDMFFAGMGGGNPVGEPVSTPEELAERISLEYAIKMFAAPPLIHGAAFLGTFIGFFQGSTVCLIRDYTGPGVLQMIQDHQINTLSIVGDAMALPLVEAGNSGDYELSSLGIISTAGAVMSESVKQRLKEVMPNAFVLDAYGSSETGYNGTATEDSSTDTGLKFRVTARTNVISDDLKIVEPGSGVVGRVAQNGHIPVGYYNDPEKTAATFPTIDGTRWILTGDSATVDEDGVIHFLGRGSVCINTGGEKVFPEEVEAALKAHESIEDAIVAGIPDDKWGERVGAVIELRPGVTDEPTLEEVREHLSTRIAGYKAPRDIEIVDKCLRSPAGKPDYGWAREVLAKAAANA
ncbi:MAG: acyl-CoA synthetase [Nitriliruptorales bacterium]|nr:acyl-CoA synthetase [Nitriliruptorales bacterium]